MEREQKPIRTYSPEALELRQQILGDLAQVDLIHKRRREPLLRALAMVEAGPSVMAGNPPPTLRV